MGRKAAWFWTRIAWVVGVLVMAFLILVSESESEWLYYIVDTLRRGQANLLMRSCTEAM